MPGSSMPATLQILVSAKPAFRMSLGRLMASAVPVSKGLQQSPPPVSLPVSLPPVTSARSLTPHNSSKVSPHTLAIEPEMTSLLAAFPRQRELRVTGRRGQASAEKLAACILGLQKTRASARCVSSNTEKINSLSPLLGKPVPQPPGSRTTSRAWAGSAAPSGAPCSKGIVRSASLKLRTRGFTKPKGRKSN